MNDFYKGLKASLPILTGLLPFGLLYGVSATAAGITKTASIAMSFIIFAGAAQMSVINSYLSGIPVTAAVTIAVLINLRMAMYGISIGEHLKSGNPLIRIISSFLLTDQAYVVSIAEYEKSNEINHLYFYLGAAFPIWMTWQAATVTGVLIGRTFPPWLPLEFAVPLTFLALLAPFIQKSRYIVTAAVSGIIMISVKNLPYNSGFFIAVFSGITAGFIYKSITGGDSE